MISLTPEQLSNTKAFFATNPSAENIYSAAQNLGLSANQLADVYSQATGGSAADALSGINQYLGQTGKTLTGGFQPSSGGTTGGTTGGAQLGGGLVPGAENITANAPSFVNITTPYGSYTADQLQSAYDFFKTPGLTGEQIYSAAQNLGLNPQQLADVYAQTTGADYGTSLENINKFLGEKGWTLEGGFGQPVSPYSAESTVYDEVANYLRSAGARTEELMNYTPEQIQAVLAQTPKTIPEVDMAAYMNPYTQEVINRTMSDIERQRQIAENALGAQATAAGAFGGSRYGVAQGVLGGEYGRIAADTAANLRQQGYTQAANLAQQDISNQIRADLANQAAQNLAAYQNVTSGLQGAQLGLSGAQQLANIGNLGFGMANTVQQQMMQQGTQQQALIQGLIDLAKAQYGGYTGAGTTGLGLIGAAGQGIPVGQTTTTSGGGLDPLSALLMIGMAPVSGGGSLFGSMLGGGAAAGAGAAGLGGGYSIASNPYILGSDIRLKDDINQIGVLSNGLPIYTWKWNDKAKEIGVEGHPTIGVMAQEAMQVIPSAVIEGDDGYLRVNYAEIWK